MLFKCPFCGHNYNTVVEDGGLSPDINKEVFIHIHNNHPDKWENGRAKERWAVIMETK